MAVMKKQSPYTVKDAFEYYLSAMKIAESTKRNFAGTQDKVEAAGLINTPISQVTPAAIRKFVNGLKGEDSTIFGHYIQLKTVINRFVSDHGIKLAFNLENIIKGPKKKEVLEGEEDYLTLSDVQLLLGIDLTAQPEIEYARDMFCLMCLTGMAVADMCKFTPKLMSADKKWLVYHRKKTHNKCEIPVFPTTLKLIEKHKWPCRISPRTMQHHCQEYISKLIAKKVTPHTARKTWGSVALELGFSMESASKMLGHSSIAITEQVYAKVTKQKISREMNEIPANIKALI